MRPIDGAELRENYVGAEFESTTLGRQVELDVYLPKEGVAFEYQGEQHYKDIYALGTRWRQKFRDEDKRGACKEMGITLIEIPYWWDFQVSSLVATVQQSRDDLLVGMKGGEPIPKEPAGGFSAGLEGIMHGEEWDGKADLTGWWMSEKLDGVRGHWDGERMMSRHGKQIFCPGWFVEKLPTDVFLDGELWAGRDSLEQLISTVNSSDAESKGWKLVKFMVFDLPSSGQPFEARMEELSKMSFPSHVGIVEHEKCVDNDYLLRRLDELVEQGGEGFVANQPGSLYVAQRTGSMLKVKVGVANDANCLRCRKTRRCKCSRFCRLASSVSSKLLTPFNPQRQRRRCHRRVSSASSGESPRNRLRRHGSTQRILPKRNFEEQLLLEIATGTVLGAALEGPKGVGTSLAQLIVRYRTQIGPNDETRSLSSTP